MLIFLPFFKNNLCLWSTELTYRQMLPPKSVKIGLTVSKYYFNYRMIRIINSVVCVNACQYYAGWKMIMRYSMTACHWNITRTIRVFNANSIFKMDSSVSPHYRLEKQFGILNLNDQMVKSTSLVSFTLMLEILRSMCLIKDLIVGWQFI